MPRLGCANVHWANRNVENSENVATKPGDELRPWLEDLGILLGFGNVPTLLARGPKSRTRQCVLSGVAIEPAVVQLVRFPVPSRSWPTRGPWSGGKAPRTEAFPSRRASARYPCQKKRIHSPLSMNLSRYRRTIDGAHGPRYLCLSGGPWRPMARAAARIV